MAPERFASAIRAGQRYVRHSLAVRRMLLRVGLFVLPGAALWALLPLVASRLLGTGPTGYGVLLAALGAGAVLGADLLPRLGGRLSPNRLLLVAGAAFTASLLACVLVTNLVVLAILLVPAGIAWLWVLMTMTGALQVFLPGWVRARGLSMYNIVFAGGQAIGALLWGLLAQWWGLLPVFLAAAAMMALGTATVGVWPLRDVAGLDRDLAVFMPDPTLVREPDPDEGPVLVTLTYTVEDDQVARVRRGHGRGPPLPVTHRRQQLRAVPGRGGPVPVPPSLAVPHLGGTPAPAHRPADRGRPGPVRGGRGAGHRAARGEAPVPPPARPEISR